MSRDELTRQRALAIVLLIVGVFALWAGLLALVCVVLT